VKKRQLAVLLISALLLVAVIPLRNMFTSSGDGSDSYTPIVSKPAWVDRNNNSIADTLDQEIAARLANGTAQEYVNVLVELNCVPTAYDEEDFVLCGGNVTTSSWTYATYGFGGRIQYDEIASFVRLDPNVLLVEKDVTCQADLAYAAKQIGARPYVWSTVGLQGDPNTSIALLDTGINPYSTDFSPGYGNLNFSDKIVGWNDQVNSRSTPYDDEGHGSNTAGLAAGDGFFPTSSSGNAIAQVSENLGYFSISGTYLMSGMMVNKTGTIKLMAKWTNSGGSASKLSGLYLCYGDYTVSTSLWTQVALLNTPSQNTWYSLSYSVSSIPSRGYAMYHIEPIVTSGSSGTSLYVTFNMSWPYTPPSDGFKAWTGIAPQSKLVEVKVLNSAGSGNATQLINGINWIIAHAKAYHITVVSMSLGSTSEEATVDTAVENLVDAGITTVCAAGNSGPSGNHIYTPGSVDTVITVAAMSEFDNVTIYSSQGGTSLDGGKTVKPDITAPGGSFYGVPTFSTSNYSGYAAPMQGTSMATPIVAGAVDIVQQAMGGYKAWSWTKSQALMPKMILLMTATETYPNLREFYTTYSPTLNNGGKDAQEGYGRLNLDAAVDAVLKSYQVGTTVSGTLGAPPTPANVSVVGQRLAWARNVQLVSGVKYNFTLSVPSGSNFDLFLYNTTGDAYGQPVILANSTKAASGGFRNIAYAPSATGEYYVVVKRATESTAGGTFSLTSSPKPSPYLFLSVQPGQASYARGQSLTFTVDVLNPLSPALVSALTLTVTGPMGYYYFDTQNASVAANSVGEYNFTWGIPYVAGAYVVEVGLIPPQLTTYDSVWLKVT
jgi:hypothetical protein